MVKSLLAKIFLGQQANVAQLLPHLLAVTEIQVQTPPGQISINKLFYVLRVASNVER